MGLRLPSLQALVVFEASARVLGFSRAAGELNVTPVAVSRMVARLEDVLGLKLFDRTRSGLTLTEHGATLQRAVASGFGQISLAIEEMKRDQASGEIVFPATKLVEYRASNPSARVRQVAEWLIAEMQGELLKAQPILDSLQMVRRP